MKRRELLAGAAAGLVGSASLYAQDNPIRITVGFAPGGGVDTVARLIAEKLKDDMRQSVIVENKPGAGGRLAADMLKNAAADGTQYMLAPVVVPVMAPLVFNKINYNPKTDFAPVIHVCNVPLALAVRSDFPAKNLNELVMWLKANPKAASFGSPAAGSLPHFFGLLLGKEANVDLIHVPYNGGAPLQLAVMGDQVPVGIDVMQEWLPNYRAGKVRILASSGDTRSKFAPDVPTFKEQGYPNIVGQSWFGLFAPARTPSAEIERINLSINKALASAEVQTRLHALGLDVAGGTPADLTKLIDADTRRWSPVVKASGFKAD